MTSVKLINHSSSTADWNNIDNFAVGKWFREVYAFRMKREPGENPGQYPLL